MAAAVLSPLAPALVGIAVVSGVVNILALTSPLFMLQVYDRVLASRSVSTLIGLATLAAVLFGFQSLLDVIRGRVLLRMGETFDRKLSGRVHEAIVSLPLEARMPGDGLQPLRDLDNVRGFLSGQGPTALFDLPWMPLYLGICFLFHFWIGITALVGAIVLVSLTVITDVLSRGPTRAAMLHGMARNAMMEAGRRNAEAVRAMGLGGRVAERWQNANTDYLAANRRTGDIAGGLGGASRSLRMILQSGMLAVGAYLVIRQETSAGVMIASSIMMGRALAPVDLAIASWRPFLMARQSWGRLKELFAMMPETRAIMALPKPERELRAEAISVAPPGEKKPTLTGASFVVPAGSALGIIGPSGSGKSTLARALVGVWAPASGKVRIDGAGFDRWNREELGRHVGYLPQGVELFDGTIAENISRFEADADAVAVVAAARAAGAHDLILRFDNGYETRIGEAGSALSAGQRQRIGLARALYGDPFLVVLDEPNANLDAEGEKAVVQAMTSVRERKGIVIVVAHRPSALGVVDLVAVIEAGRMKAFGPRDEVLSRTLKGANPPATTVTTAAGYSTGFRAIAPFRVVATGATEPGAGRSPDQHADEADVER
nr:type I secretion system permease/ATPase [Bradyrhizobium valentinum]